MKEIVLLFHTDNEEEERVRRACSKCGIEEMTASGKQELAPLGMLAGMPPEERAGGIGIAAPAGAKLPDRKSFPLREPVIVMAGLSDRRLDELLAAFRSEHCRTDLKAVLTRYNADWNVRDLSVQLTAEREAVRGGGRLHGIQAADIKGPEQSG